MKPPLDPRPQDVPWPHLLSVPAGTVLVGDWVSLSIADPVHDSEWLFAALEDASVWTHPRCA